jgi:catalase (peroxidase I)
MKLPSNNHIVAYCLLSLSDGYVGPWSGDPLVFDNSYFVLLEGQRWTPDAAAAKLQYKDPSGTYMMLPSDIALIEDAEFKKYVEEYAKVGLIFFF